MIAHHTQASASCLSYLDLHLTSICSSTIIRGQCAFGIQELSNFPKECRGPSGLGEGGQGPGQLGAGLPPSSRLDGQGPGTGVALSETLLRPHHPSRASPGDWDSRRSWLSCSPGEMSGVQQQGHTQSLYLLWGWGWGARGRAQPKRMGSLLPFNRYL